jgi:hypothetical protein
MKRIILTIGIALIAIGTTAFVAGARTSRPVASVNPVWKVVLKAREGTAKYQDVKQAVKDGYARVSACVEAPDGSGAMGIHYLNAAYAKDPAIRAGKPELLLYIPDGTGKLRLAGVEWFRPDADQDLSTTVDRPSIAGLPFDGPMEGHDPGMPRHYDLHAWIWDWNPAGVFKQFNPTLHCA